MRIRTPASGRSRFKLTPFLVVASLSQLAGCFLFNEFKTDGQLIKDDCFELTSASLCIDFDAGQLQASGLQARVADGTHCKPIKKIKITGWVDKNDNDVEDEGEAIESTEHEVAEEEGSNSVDMGELSLSLNAGSSEASDVHIVIEVERVGSSTVQRYPQKIRKC